METMGKKWALFDGEFQIVLLNTLSGKSGTFFHFLLYFEH